MISAKVLGTGGNEVVRILKDLRLRGFVILADATPQEVQRFLERVGAITPKDAEGDGDATAVSVGGVTGAFSFLAGLQAASSSAAPSKIIPERFIIFLPMECCR